MYRNRITTLRLACAAVTIGSLLFSSPPPSVAAFLGQQHVNLDNPAVPFSQADTLLHIRDSQVKVNGQLLFRVGGRTGGYVIWFNSPKYGRYIFSTRPHPKYEFEEVQVIDNHRIAFSSEGRHFEWIVSEPLVEKGTIRHLWMMHDKHPEPIKDRKVDGGEIGASTHYEYLLRNP